MPNAQRRSAEIVTLAFVLSVARGEAPAIVCPIEGCQYRGYYPPRDPNRAWAALRNHALRAHNMTVPDFSQTLIEAVEHTHSAAPPSSTVALTLAIDPSPLPIHSCPPCPDPPFCAARVAEGYPLPCELVPIPLQKP